MRLPPTEFEPCGRGIALLPRPTCVIALVFDEESVESIAAWLAQLGSTAVMRIIGLYVEKDPVPSALDLIPLALHAQALRRQHVLCSLITCFDDRLTLFATVAWSDKAVTRYVGRCQPDLVVSGMAKQQTVRRRARRLVSHVGIDVPIVDVESQRWHD